MSDEARPLRARDEAGNLVEVMAERKVLDTEAGLCHWPWVYWVVSSEGRKWATRHSDGTLVVVDRTSVYRLTLEEDASFGEEHLVVDRRSNVSHKWIRP